MTTTKHHIDYLLAPINMNHLLTLNGITILQFKFFGTTDYTCKFN